MAGRQTLVRPLFLFLGFALSGTAAQPPVETPRVIRVVLDSAQAPYSFRAHDGQLQGILVDHWRLWERQTGIKVELHAMDWDQAQRRMRAGEFDVIDSIVETPERQRYFDFTPPYASAEVSIYFRSNISGITDLGSLRGFPVGVKRGTSMTDQLRAEGVTTAMLFENIEAIIDAAKQQKINVFVAEDLSAQYHLSKAGIEAGFRRSAPIFRGDMRRAVRKGESALLRTVADGFAAIDAEELKQINNKWFGRTIDRYARYLVRAGYAAAAALLVIVGLLGWNRALRGRVMQRTAALETSERRLREVAERIREVSEQREAHLRLVIDTIPTMAWSLLPAGSVDFVNQRWLDYTGLSLAQALEDANRIVHPEDLPKVMELWSVAKARGSSFDVELRLRRADGGYHCCLVRTVPLRDEQGHIVRWYGTSTDIEDRKRAEDALRDAGDELQGLSRRLVDARESERKELARELHDRVGQNLTALNINLSMLRANLSVQAVEGFGVRLKDSLALVESTTEVIGNVVSELHPPMLDEQGLVRALEWYAKQFSARTEISVRVRSAEPDDRPAPAAEIAFFRIAQEALNNVAKHARASQVEITVERSGPDCVMSIQDNGVGFDVAEAHAAWHLRLGLVTMRERAQAVGASFDILTRRGKGTRLTMRVPA